MPGAPKEPEAQATWLSSDRLCDELCLLADQQNVRTAEALAAALINRASRAPRGTADAQPDAPASMSSTMPQAGAHRAMLQRIARRALSGSLQDPTAGATAFHRIEATPEWAKDRLPVAVFGAYLFYRA